MFYCVIPIGSISQLKTGDAIDQGIVKEIHFVGLSEDKLVITGVVSQPKPFKNGDHVTHIKYREYGVGVVTDVRNTSAWVTWENGITGTPHMKNLVKFCACAIESNE